MSRSKRIQLIGIGQNVKFMKDFTYFNYKKPLTIIGRIGKQWNTNYVGQYLNLYI